MNAELIERLAEVSHRGWMKARIAQGWAVHPLAIINFATLGDPFPASCGRCDKPLDKHHPSMVPYADLPEADKEASREPVRAVLDALEEKVEEHDGPCPICGGYIHLFGKPEPHRTV